ncbi:MAG: hypothetical protein JWP87_6068 [Labilithrix sp.]|nr:hypothetical protein [Labilithrix sp.]
MMRQCRNPVLPRAPLLLLIALAGCRPERTPPRPAAPASASASAPAYPGTPIEGETPRRYPDARAYCMDFVARATRELREAGGFPHLRPTNPSCRESKLPVPFEGGPVFTSAHAFAIDSGLATEQRLVIELTDGLEDTPIVWSYQNLHAAQSVPYPATLESLRVDEGKLVAVVGREHVWFLPDATGDAGTPERFLVRGVVACEPGPTLRCTSWFTDASAPWLGMKRRAFDATTPWQRLAWDRTPAFTIGAGAMLTVTTACPSCNSR